MHKQGCNFHNYWREVYETAIHLPLLQFKAALSAHLFAILAEVLAELQEYATRTPPPTDAPSVTNTVAYLKACNQLFERGILGKWVFVKSPSNPIIASMDEGFTYFTTWLDCELSKGITIGNQYI